MLVGIDIKFPLYVFKILKLCLFCFPMQVDYCSHKLFSQKIPMHRKWVRLKCASHILHDDVFMLQSLSFMWTSLKSSCLARGVKRQRLLGGNPTLFWFLAFCFCLVINNSSSLQLDVLLCFNQCLCQVEPLGRLGESLCDHAVKNRNFSAHEISCHFYRRVILG